MPLLEAAKPSLIDINFGLMFWTIVAFLVTLIVLKRYAFGPIQAMLDDRSNAIAADIDAAEQAREEAQTALSEYRAALAESRKEATQIVESARRTAEEQRREALAELEAEKARQVERARAEIDSERRRSLQEVKATLADLTVAATEKVVRKRLDESEQKRLIDEALSDVDLSAFSTAQAEGDG
jgi:F-type H+-transporting ATPase subunit b